MTKICLISSSVRCLALHGLPLWTYFLFAAVDDSAVFIYRMPYFSPVPTAAAAAFYFVREDTHTAVLAILLSTLYL